MAPGWTRSEPSGESFCASAPARRPGRPPGAHPSSPPPLENWAAPMRTVRSVAGGSDMPVLVASGFVEASDPAALEDPKLREVLFAPLTMYPPGGRVIRLPFRLDKSSIPYLERVLAKDLEGQTRFLFVGRLYGLTFEPWLRTRLAERGFRSEQIAGFGNIGIYLFRVNGS